MEELNYKCIQCGSPCKYPMSICTKCIDHAKQEKANYLKHLGYEVKDYD